MKYIQDFSGHLQTLFQQGSGIRNTRQLIRASEKYGLHPGVDFTSIKSLYDLAEFSLNQILSQLFLEETVTLEYLEELSKLLPVYENNQGYKVEPGEYTVIFGATAVALNADSVVIDPSAGTGNLAECARLCNVRNVLVNELHDFRYQLLLHGNYLQCTQEDALQLNNE